MSSKSKRQSTKKKRISKSKDFLEKIQTGSPMLKYFSDIGLINPASKHSRLINEPNREGSFISIAHANQEFTAPILSKGKSKKRKTKLKKTR